MVEIQCVACEKIIKPRQLNDNDNYDTKNYDGQVVCQECKSLLYVKSVKGKVQKTKLVEKIIPPSGPRIEHVEIIKDYGQGRQVREEDKSEE